MRNAVSFWGFLAAVILIVSGAATAETISDDMETDLWAFGHANELTDCTWAAEYSTADYVSPERSIRLFVENGGTAGNDADWAIATREFENDGQATNMSLSYKVAQQTDGPDGWGGAASYVDVIVIALDGEGNELGRAVYRLASVRCDAHDPNYEAGVIYIIPEGIERDVDGDIHLDPETWYLLSVAPNQDIDVDWSQVASLGIELSAGGTYMYLDAIEAYFDDLQIMSGRMVVKPESLNLTSKGVFTVFIYGLDAKEIDLDSLVCSGAPVLRARRTGNGRIVAKFKRQDLVDVEESESAELVLTGSFISGGSFILTDTVRTFDPIKEKCDRLIERFQERVQKLIERQERRLLRLQARHQRRMTRYQEAGDTEKMQRLVERSNERLQRILDKGEAQLTRLVERTNARLERYGDERRVGEGIELPTLEDFVLP